MKLHRRMDAAFMKGLKPAMIDSIWKIYWLNSKTHGTPSVASLWRGRIQAVGATFYQTKKETKMLNLPNILVCFSQTAQAGGSTAVLRQIH